MNQPNRLSADAAHQFGGIELDRDKPLRFRLNGRRIDAFAGDTVLSAALASGIDSYGRFGDTVLGLTDRFAPLVVDKGGVLLPMDRLPAVDGLDLKTAGPRYFSLRSPGTLGHRIDGIAEAPWLRMKPETSLSADLLIIGGGVAGLAAAEAAANAGRSVVLVERRPWLGGDARYFGAVGDEASPEAVTSDLIGKLRAQANVTVLTHADVFALHGSTAHLHQIEETRGRVVAVAAARVLLATGSQQRLPIFAGNRLPGVVGAMSAYHLAKRYGVAHGRSAIVATQSNYGYRLALRLHEAGIAIRRVVDLRVNAQSRFVDFAKASGLTLAGGQMPAAVTGASRHGLHASFVNAGTSTISLTLDADQVIVSGPFQPDLNLWMLAGGGTQWVEGKLLPRGQVEHFALAGSAAGYRSLRGCAESGRVAQAHLFGAPTTAVDDAELGGQFETAEGPTTIGPTLPGAPSFFDAGTSLIARPIPSAKPMLTTHAQAPSLGDVAASVELGLTSPADAGAVAEERGAPGGDLAASNWVPAEKPAADIPAWLTGRFGADPATLHLIVDGRRKFERGALVYANTAPADPMLAIGVIVAAAPDNGAGGMAMISAAALKKIDRFIVETADGPSPARIAAS